MSATANTASSKCSYVLGDDGLASWSKLHADAWIGLRIMRFNALRTLSTMEGGAPGPEASITKLYWATWHRNLGELAADVLGPRLELDEELQRMFLFARADTIYGGSNQIQRNVIGERVLGLPPEPRAGT